MLKFIKQGDIFTSKAQAICNAVNCVGVMGGGLAAHFKRRYPEMFADYAKYCAEKKLKPGGIHVWTPKTPPCIFNVATKDDWLQNSLYEWVADGLKNIAYEAHYLGIPSIAVPALGCGLGGLEWDRVKKLIEEADAQHWQGLDVEVYEPL